MEVSHEVAGPDLDLVVVGPTIEVFSGDKEREDMRGVAFQGGDALVVDGGGWRFEVVGGGGERREGSEAALGGER